MSLQNVPAAATNVSATASPSAWPVLTANERRVLGVLVEKAKTTPDVYPLSMNSLVTGCNQKSNREPVMNLQDFEVEDALSAAQKKQLVFKVIGGRVERWRHALYETWRVNKVELAVLGELLLRGAQTEGELRARASRMEPIEDLEGLRKVLHVLAERRLVVYLTPEGRRGTTLTHGFHTANELDRLRAAAPSAGEADDVELAVSAPRVSRDESASFSDKLTSAQVEIENLRKEVQSLQSIVNGLAAEVQGLKASLGG